MQQPWSYQREEESLAIGGAIIALAAFASTANAGMTSVNMTTSIGRTDTRIPMTTTIGTIRTFSPDGHVSSHGLEVGKHSHRKDTTDHTDGEQPDPPKTTGGTGGTASNGGKTGGTYPQGPSFPDWQKKHGGYGPGPHVNWTPEPPLACKGRPGAC